ncbi:TRAF4 [Lepeophtheirus salmonis]|uniref:TRAF4 n=1 Tax=Lepeophtheirus salmonis TaxID=72036 RepID=A0A7R8H0T7_LEPSM|nr:TRAF4 [Lepeophtheirus salmonis]CAF2795757.1 TRAF4 [Lepeophtheirus salmonis]
MSCTSLLWTSIPNKLRQKNRRSTGSPDIWNQSQYNDEENSSSGQHCLSESEEPCPRYEEVVGEGPSLVYNLSGAEGELYSNFYTNETKSHDSPPTSFIATTDPQTKQKILNSIVYCIHKEEGCKWSGPLCKLKGHLNTCQKDAVSCPNQCGSKIARVNMEDHMMYTCSKRLISCIFCKRDFTVAVISDHAGKCGFEPIYCENKCGQKIQRNRLKAHQVNTCSKRIVSCTYCSRNFTADTLQNHHTKCYMFPVPCPNRCEQSGELGIPREDLERHLGDECGKHMSALLCEYHEAGCRFRSTDPESLESHLKEKVTFHLDLMASLVHKQKGQIKQLLNQVELAHTSYNGILLWKIKNISTKMQESKATSLFLNGNGGGEGSHMSIYIKLLPGDYDSILKWPFKHTVSFSLLDQNENKKKVVNVVESFIPDPTWANFCKPQKDQLGFGFPKFVSHTMLNSRDYIKDNCIFIKIRADPSRNVAV